MQNWLQRAAIWTAIGVFLAQLPITWHSIALILVLMFILEYLAAQQGARQGVDIVLSLKESSIMKLKSMFNRAARGEPIDREELQRILRGD